MIIVGEEVKGNRGAVLVSSKNSMAIFVSYFINESFYIRRTGICVLEIHVLVYHSVILNYCASFFVIHRMLFFFI